MYILSKFQAKVFLLERKEFSVSLDLGLTKTKIQFVDGFFIFPDGQKITIDHIKKIIKKDTSCFSIENNDIIKLSLFSDDTNKYYKLMPTGIDTPPTLEISGIRMHVTKSMSAEEDTKKKISFVEPCFGYVLDTCTGLGYTAILASHTARQVFTYEIDENCVEVQKINPWSKELFNNPKIKMNIGDIFLEIKKLKNNFFDRIIHDPPRLTFATVLYSQGFYDELFRVLKHKGKIYHYTGHPGSKNRGVHLQDNVLKRMQRSGFKNLKKVFNGVSGEKI